MGLRDTTDNRFFFVDFFLLKHATISENERGKSNILPLEQKAKKSILV